MDSVPCHCKIVISSRNTGNSNERHQAPFCLSSLSIASGLVRGDNSKNTVFMIFMIYFKPLSQLDAHEAIQIARLCFATNTSFHWMETFTHLLVVYCFRLAEEQESQQGTDVVSPHQRRETFILWQRQVSSAECRAQNCLSPWHRRTNTVPLAKDATGVWVLAELQSVWQEEGMCKSFSLLGDSRLCY